MAKRVSFSDQTLKLDDVVQVQGDAEKSLRFYYNATGLVTRDPKFVPYSLDEVQRELDERITELDHSAAFNVLAALEASFRTDFLIRCYERHKDALSRHFRGVYKRKGSRVAFEEDILSGWKQHVPTTKALISEIIGAFHYRNWLAHGRYWVPKFGRRYDYFSVYLLARQMQTHF